MKLFDLTGKVAIVTGGNGGIGLGMARGLAQAGAAVAVAGRQAGKSATAVKELEALGARAMAVEVDVRKEPSCRAMVQAVVDRFGRLDILVNNAGVSGSSDPDITSSQAWDLIMGVNAKGVFLGMKHAVPAMRQGGGGAIVNISSISGFVGQDRLHMAYNASKGAVRIMTKSAAVQHARDGIRVNSVHPGFMPPMRTSKVSADPAWRKPFLDAVPLRREGRVEEVAHAVLFLASDEASYITGTELVVDGGFLAV